MVEKIRDDKIDNVIVDGFRAPGEVELFRKTFKNFILIYVDTTLENRFNRRKLDDPNATIEDVKTRDEIDIKNKGMDKVFELADFKIDNNGTKKDLYGRVEDVISGLDIL